MKRTSENRKYSSFKTKQNTSFRYFVKVLLTVIAISISLTANTFAMNLGEDEIKPVIPIESEKVMFEKTYTLLSVTDGNAGIYTNESNNRATDYVVAALNEAGIDCYMNDYDKVLAINNYLCERFTYANYATVDGYVKENWVPFTDYCLIEGQSGAVCAGFAEAFQSMCIACGIECYYVTGYTYQGEETEGTYHAWNRVIIGEKSYYIDTCWNDSSQNSYFLSADGWDDHEIEKECEIYRISSQSLPLPDYMK